MEEGTWRKLICARVREVRRRIGLSQMDFAYKADLSHHTIGKIERNEVFPTLETLIRLSEAHHVPLADFLIEPTRMSARGERAMRELVTILRGQEERKIDLVVGLARYLLRKL